MSELEQLIKTNVFFEGVSATGFHKVKCPVCNDYKVRAGFKFEADHIAYSCFRGKCPIQAVVQKHDEYVTKKFRTVLEAFNIELPLELKMQGKRRIQEQIDTTLFEKHWYQAIETPDDFVLYDPDHHHRYRDYLASRGFTDDLYMIGRKGWWKDRLIVPFFLGEKLIGWEGVLINARPHEQRYLKSSGNTDLLYFPEAHVPREPIIVEGLFDAKSIPDGVGTLASTVTKKQAYILRHTNPILVPDRKDSNFIDVAKRYGWRVSIPEWKAKDPNELRVKYGRLVLARMIYDGLCDTLLQAEVRYRLWKT